jgi:hypothetical protein
MSTIFFSWQADRSTSVCRNVIDRALEAAVNRLRADIDIEMPDRDSLEVDRDTRNVAGTPAVFDTIMEKITSASIFVPDLTFVGQRVDGRPTSNPNVLIEYGFALAKVGWPRIVTVMNDSYGKPSEINMPFNLAHTRFPITYSLSEAAGQEDRNNTQRTLGKKFEIAFRNIFQSKAFKAQAEARKSALDIAAAYRTDVDFEEEQSALRSSGGLARVRESLGKLFKFIAQKCNEINARHEVGIECGCKIEASEHSPSCVLRCTLFGMVVRWEQRNIHSLDGSGLDIEIYEGHLFLPGEPLPRVHLVHPQKLSAARYEATLSREDTTDLGWVDANDRKGAGFLSNEKLADDCLSGLLTAMQGARRRD